MNRTQIYLTPDQAEGVARVANETGRNQSEVIREALDLYLKRTGTQDRLRRLRSGRGMWKGRKDVDARKLREDFDRY